MSANDAQLLEQFTNRREETAFAAIVERHGPMVLGVCRRVLHDANDAEDAFQATFLILARKAQAIRKKDSVGSWLYGVAYRVASRLKAIATSRREAERRAGEMSMSDSGASDLLSAVIWREIRPVLDQELSQLPEKYRAPVLLCYLQGRTHEEAARELGWPAGSMSRRLEKARELLRSRLVRRGITLSTGLLFGVLSNQVALAAVPAALAESTVRAALLLSAGKAAAAGIVSIKVAVLMEGVLRAMFMSKLKFAAVILLVLGVAGAGTGMLAVHALAEKQPTVQVAAPKPGAPGERKPGGEASKPAPTPQEPSDSAEEAEPAVPVKAEEIRRVLNQPTYKLKGGIDQGTPLQDALDTIGRLHDIRFEFDRTLLKNVGEMQIGQKPVHVPPTRGVALGVVLRDMLGEVDPPLAYLVRGNHVVIVPYTVMAPEALFDELTNAEFDKIPLEVALRELSDMTGVTVLVDMRIGDKAQKPVIANLQNVPIQTAVRLLADMTDLKSVAVDNVLYVTTKENGEKLQKTLEQEDEKRIERGLPERRLNVPRRLDRAGPGGGM